MAGKPTIGLVAKRAGVSVASVSRVINGTMARPATEARVRRAIEELGYQPNSAARALKVRQSDQICISFADVGNPAYIAITRGISSALHNSKYRIILSSSLGSEEEIVNHLLSLGRGYADGLIVSPIITNAEIARVISELAIPIVLIGTLPTGLKIDNVYVDSSQGVQLAVEHLRETGRKKIALINGPLATNPGKRRHKGFVDAMNSFKLKYSDSSIFFADDFTSGSAERILEKNREIEKFDAVVCANDLLAAGTIKTLLARDISVGEEIAVTGMDNTDLATIIYPSLTSVDLGAERRGELAAELLLERIENPDAKPRKVEVKPRLVVRASTVPSKKTVR